MRVEPRFVPPLMPSGMGGVSVFQEVFGLTRLGETLRAYQARDPAARSRLEIFLLYPGVHALIYHRIALSLPAPALLPGPAGEPVEPLLDGN